MVESEWILNFRSHQMFSNTTIVQNLMFWDIIRP